MALPSFTPCYILPNELTAFGLPSMQDQPDILGLVISMSSYVDELCGRMDGDGSGSLVYSTYQEQIMVPTANRNLIYLSHKPITGLTQDTVTGLQVAASGQNLNYSYTGVLPATFNNLDGTLSGILSASGRYGYTREDQTIGYPDRYAMINPMNLVAMFGGPAPYVSIDVTKCSYDKRTGEVWIPAGLYFQRYSEVIFTYTSGFDPLNIPRLIKFVTSALVKNALAKGDGTTGLKTLTLGRLGANATFDPNLMDSTLDTMLSPFRDVVGR